MILSAQTLDATPRKVAPKPIVYAAIGLGLALVGVSWALLGRQGHIGATAILVTLLVDGLILIPTLVLPLGRFRREAQLLKWGVATSAQITSRSVATGRSGNHLALTYAFTDESARTVRGSRVLWGDIKADGRTSDPNILDALAAPTVFYGRENSQNHLFHPSVVAELRN